MKRLIKYAVFGLFILSFSFVLKTSSYAAGAFNTGSDDTKRCVIVIGDSRVCGLLCTLMKTSYIETINTDVNNNGMLMSGLFRVGNTWLVMSGEMSGRLSLNSYDNSVTTVKNIIESKSELKDADKYIFINMYGINDLYHNQTNASVYPEKYMVKNENIVNELNYCDRIYQFTSGPIDNRGIVYERGFRNEYIEKYNELFKSSENVEVIDQYTYLVSNGYNGILDGEVTDHSGLHYDDPTNRSVYRLIMKVARK